MSHQSRVEGLTSQEADELADEWKQLGATNIKREPEANGRFTMTATFPGSPFATEDEAEVTTAVPSVMSAAPKAISTSLDFQDIAGEYRSLFDVCVPDPQRKSSIEAQLKKVRPGEMRYRALGQRLDIPWHFIAIVHSLECGSDFKLHLHNGDPLSARTVRVPKGRPQEGQPPFTWEESAQDAFEMKGYVGQADWSLAAMLFRWETFNGMGYRVRGLPSPYLWSFSNIYERGLFVADHVFDANAKSRQCGAAVLLKQLQAL